MDYHAISHIVNFMSSYDISRIKIQYDGGGDSGNVTKLLAYNQDGEEIHFDFQKIIHTVGLYDIKVISQSAIRYEPRYLPSSRPVGDLLHDVYYSILSDIGETNYGDGDGGGGEIDIYQNFVLIHHFTNNFDSEEQFHQTHKHSKDYPILGRVRAGLEDGNSDSCNILIKSLDNGNHFVDDLYFLPYKNVASSSSIFDNQELIAEIKTLIDESPADLEEDDDFFHLKIHAYQNEFDFSMDAAVNNIIDIYQAWDLSSKNRIDYEDASNLVSQRKSQGMRP